MGWLFRRREVSADVTRLSDLWALRSIRLQHRAYPVVAVGIGLVLPMVIAARWGDPWGGLFVAGFLRAAVLLQATFCVNSLAHLVGRPRYDPSLLGQGQPAHRARHVRRGLPQLPSPLSVRLSQRSRWWQYDPSKWLIWTLSRSGLAHKVRTASKGSIAKAAP